MLKRQQVVSGTIKKTMLKARQEKVLLSFHNFLLIKESQHETRC